MIFSSLFYAFGKIDYAEEWILISLLEAFIWIMGSIVVMAIITGGCS